MFIIKIYIKATKYSSQFKQTSKKNHIHSLESNSRDFWKSCKTFFSEEYSYEKIVLLDSKNNIISDGTRVATIFNSYFINITDGLSIEPWESQHTNLPDNCSKLRYIDSANKNFEDLPSIREIGETNRGNVFSLSQISEHDVLQVTLKQNHKKGANGPIPMRVIKMVSDIISKPLTNCINADISKNVFLHSLKLAEVVPVHRKEYKTLKENYRPISISPSFSKIYERLLYNQLSKYFENILSTHLCGFRSRYSTQHDLI